MDHKWTEEDDIMAFYLYKHGDEGLLFSREKICDKLEMQIGTMRMREGKFKSLDTGKGLSHFAPNKSGRIMKNTKKRQRTGSQSWSMIF